MENVKKTLRTSNEQVKPGVQNTLSASYGWIKEQIVKVGLRMSATITTVKDALSARWCARVQIGAAGAGAGAANRSALLSLG